MKSIPIAPALGVLCVALATPAPARAQADKSDHGSKSFQSREDLNAHYDKARQQLDEDYQKRLADLEKRRISDLAALAEKGGDDAGSLYQQAFYEAIARDQYDAAEGAADRCLKSDKIDRKLRALATFVKIVAEADGGKTDQSIKDLRTFLNDRPESAKKLDARTIFAVGEAFLSRLIRRGQYDDARKVAGLFLEGEPEEAVKAHFQSRLDLLQRLGKPAPKIDAKDVDGEPVSLADLKGKVVLVDFWATWCPPCLAEVDEFRRLRATYHDRGFEIVGINVDAANERVGDKSKVRAAVRQFLVDAGVTWPVVLNGEGEQDFTRAYGVGVIPAAFLVDRDGKVVGVEQSGEALEKAIEAALGDAKPDGRKQASR